MARTRLVAGYRLLFGLLAAVALAYTGYHAATAHQAVGNFFSYFTIESNILAALTFGWGGLAGLAGRRGAPDLLRGAVVVYLVITGAVFAVLLADIPNQTIQPWVNSVVHEVLPIVVVLDWLLVPPRGPLPARRVSWWLAFPLAYVTYTLMRGPFAHWYPYPFLDPRPHGYPHVLGNALGIAVGFVVVALLVRLVGLGLGRRLTARSARSARPASAGAPPAPAAR